MLSTLRLSSTTIARQHLLRITTQRLILHNAVHLNARQARRPPRFDHDKHNMRLLRPMSPHLTIYQIQLTSILSISHRFAGLALTGLLVLLALGAIAFPGRIPVAVENMQLSALTLYGLKCAMAWPMCYHTYNGIRHLFWDCGMYLDSIKDVYSTGYAMLAASAITTVILTFI